MFPCLATSNHIEVYGEPKEGWYEWCVVTLAGVVLRGTADMGYRSPEIALRSSYALFVKGLKRSAEPFVWLPGMKMPTVIFISVFMVANAFMRHLRM